MGVLRPRRGDDGHPRGAGRPPERPPRHDAPRAGRGVHGRRVRPADRPLRRRDGHAGTRRDEPRHRHRRRLPRPRPDGRDHRPDRDRQGPQGVAPVRRHPAHVRARHQVDVAGRGAGCHPRDRRQGVPRGAAGEAGPHPHRAARGHRRDRGRRRAGPAGAAGRRLPRADRRGDRARRRPDRRRPAPDRAGGQRRAPPARVPGAARVRARAPRPGGRHVHGQGRDRRPVAPVPDGGRAPGARSRPVGLRPGRPGDLGGLRPGRVRARALEPGRRPSDRAHRHDARRRWTRRTGPRSS